MANDRARPADATPQPARLMLYSQEHYDLMSQFEREHTGHRLTREPKALWALGIVYQDGEVNGLFLSYRRGYAFGKAVWQPAAAPLASSPSAEPVSEQEHSGSTEKALPAVANQQQEPEPKHESPSRTVCVDCGLTSREMIRIDRGWVCVDDCSTRRAQIDAWFMEHYTDASRGDSVLAVDKASEREPPSRSSPNEVAPAAALTTQTVIGEAPLAGAPSEDDAFADADAVLRHLGYATLADRLLASLQSERLARETAEQDTALLDRTYPLVYGGTSPATLCPFTGRELLRAMAQRDDALAAPHPETRHE